MRKTKEFGQTCSDLGELVPRKCDFDEFVVGGLTLIIYDGCGNSTLFQEVGTKSLAYTKRRGFSLLH